MHVTINTLILRRAFLCLLMAASLATPPSAALAVEWTTPYVEPQDSLSAFSKSDEYAWRLFVALNWPAAPSGRVADTTKKLGDEGQVVWETWKNAREVYLRKGADPGPWDAVLAPAVVPAPSRFDDMPLQQMLRQRRLGAGAQIMFDPIAAANSVNETRLNKETYDFVRQNELYNLDGQIKLYKDGVDIQFPLMAKEIKAQWRVIKAEQRSRYHTVEVKAADGVKTLYGLTALHITTKDLPNWLWATFEHVDNPTLPKNEKWMLKSRDAFACKGASLDCNKAPAGIGLEGTKWQNYRLRGTQIDFTDARGNPTILANSQPEEGFQTTSSCITCHARASIGLINGAPERLSIFVTSLDDWKDVNTPIPTEGYIGAPRSEWFYTDVDSGRIRLFTQQDFVWSLFRALPKE